MSQWEFEHYTLQGIQTCRSPILLGALIAYVACLVASIVTTLSTEEAKTPGAVKVHGVGVKAIYINTFIALTAMFIFAIFGTVRLTADVLNRKNLSASDFITRNSDYMCYLTEQNHTINIEDCTVIDNYLYYEGDGNSYYVSLSSGAVLQEAGEAVVIDSDELKAMDTYVATGEYLNIYSTTSAKFVKLGHLLNMLANVTKYSAEELEDQIDYNSFWTRIDQT